MGTAEPMLGTWAGGREGRKGGIGQLDIRVWRVGIAMACWGAGEWGDSWRGCGGTMRSTMASIELSELGLSAPLLEASVVRTTTSTSGLELRDELARDARADGPASGKPGVSLPSRIGERAICHMSGLESSTRSEPRAFFSATISSQTRRTRWTGAPPATS